MKIGVFNSAWGNMGNAFFSYGLISLLRKLYPESDVQELDEPYPYVAPVGNLRLRGHAFSLAEIQEADVYVFSGPILAQILRPNFGFSTLIQKILEGGKKYMVLSASASEMGVDEIQKTADFLNANPPLAFATRDEPTYEKFKDLTPFCHNGICGAFLIPLIKGVADVKPIRPYFISSFYKKPEPVFSIEGEGQVSVDALRIDFRKPFLRGVRFGYARHFEFLRNYPSRLNGVDIVRVHQGFNPAMKLFNYAQPNSFVSFNPLSYLSVYKGCEFVVSDRVHACAAALAYGHPARLLDENDRMGIFARMGIVRDERGIMRPLGREDYQAIIKDFSQYLKQVL